MFASFISAFGGPDVLELRDVETPRLREREVLVRVRASALNRADLLQRQGKYPPPPGVSAEIPGIEFAGEVSARGPGATRWPIGARVFSIIGGGAHAEFVAIHEDEVAGIPEHLSWHEAAAVPEAFITAHDAMISQAGLRAGETLLVHAVGSGVGLAAIQLARAIGARAFGTSRSAEKLERARPFGLDGGICLTGDLSPLGVAAGPWTGGRGFDVVLDLVGGSYLAASLDCMALHGRLMVVGTMGGGQATIDLRRILGKRLTIRGTVLRARLHDEKVQVVEAFAREVVPRLGVGGLVPVIDVVLPIARISEAHRRLESNATFGKVVLDHTTT
jgi:putative PIG3 family NAD(P)H quinone oxidoreductase